MVERMLALGMCLVWTAVWVALALPPQGRLRKRLSEQLSASDDHPSISGELDRLLRKSALIAAAWLAPPALVSLAIGLWAALGEGTLAP